MLSDRSAADEAAGPQRTGGTITAGLWRTSHASIPYIGKYFKHLLPKKVSPHDSSEAVHAVLASLGEALPQLHAQDSSLNPDYRHSMRNLLKPLIAFHPKALFTCTT